MDKPQLRRNFCSLRECLPAEEVSAASTAICQRLAAWLPSQLQSPFSALHSPLSIPHPPLSILTYLAFRNEPDLSLLFDLFPDVRWAIPRIEGKHLVLHPHDPTRLVRHRFGMLEPAADLPVVDPTTLDLVLVPGVAFDRRGGRLGFGGGYYDRFLPTTPALRVGVTYDPCLADSLPCSDHDQHIDWVVTPTQEIYCTPLWKVECAPS
jgi:5-formyltetrahydrofolate cyclo-ligase